MRRTFAGPIAVLYSTRDERASLASSAHVGVNGKQAPPSSDCCPRSTYATLVCMASRGSWCLSIASTLRHGLWTSGPEPAAHRVTLVLVAVTPPNAHHAYASSRGISWLHLPLQARDGLHARPQLTLQADTRSIRLKEDLRLVALVLRAALHPVSERAMHGGGGVCTSMCTRISRRHSGPLHAWRRAQPPIDRGKTQTLQAAWARLYVAQAVRTGFKMPQDCNCAVVNTKVACNMLFGRSGANSSALDMPASRHIRLGVTAACTQAWAAEGRAASGSRFARTGTSAASDPRTSTNKNLHGLNAEMDVLCYRLLLGASLQLRC